MQNNRDVYLMCSRTLLSMYVYTYYIERIGLGEGRREGRERKLDDRGRESDIEGQLTHFHSLGPSPMYQLTFQPFHVQLGWSIHLVVLDKRSKCVMKE